MSTALRLQFARSIDCKGVFSGLQNRKIHLNLNKIQPNQNVKRLSLGFYYIYKIKNIYLINTETGSASRPVSIKLNNW